MSDAPTMFIRFRIGRSSGDRFGFRHVPVYSMRDWHIDFADPTGVIMCRPSLQTLGRRVLWSLQPVALLAVLFWQCGLPWQESKHQRRMPVETAASQRALERDQTDKLRQSLPPEKWRQFEAAQGEKRRQRQAELARREAKQDAFRTLGTTAYWTATYGLLAIAVLPLLLIPVHRVTVTRGRDNDLVIRMRGLWPTVRRVPVKSINRILVGPEEDISRAKGIRFRNGWRWLVRVLGSRPSGRPNEPEEEMEVTFFMDFQKEQPADPAHPPRRVQTFVECLSHMTGVSNVAYAIPGQRFGRPGRYGWPVRRTSVEVSGEPENEQHVFRSLDEVPEHLRDEVERLTEQSQRTGQREIHTVRVTIRDSDGREVTYNSLNEMPPDVRARYERVIRESRQGPDHD